jgi:hypothetical protein
MAAYSHHTVPTQFVECNGIGSLFQYPEMFVRDVAGSSTKLNGCEPPRLLHQMRLARIAAPFFSTSTKE